MNDDATKQLRLDRRLAGRRGWISEDELSRELHQLADVAEKGELIDAPAPRRREESSPQGS